MYKVSLTGLKFVANHGVHQEEALVGNSFIVDVEIQRQRALPEVDLLLADCVDYGVVYSIVEKEMNRTTPLLETVCRRIIEAVKNEYIGTEVLVRITKNRAPIVGLNGSVTVEIQG